MMSRWAGQWTTAASPSSGLKDNGLSLTMGYGYSQTTGTFSSPSIASPHLAAHLHVVL